MTTGIEREVHRLRDARGECPDHPLPVFKTQTDRERERQDKVRSRAEGPSDSRLPAYARGSMRRLGRDPLPPAG